MNRDGGSEPSISRTSIDPSVDEVELQAWVAPLKCEGCEGRVDTFCRYRANTEARCAGCGSEWELVGGESP